MRLSKIVITSIALGALAFSNFSFAVPITLQIQSGTTNVTKSASDNVSYVSSVDGAVDGWLLNINTALAGNFAVDPAIFSLNTTASKNGVFDLTITAIATGFTDAGSLSAQFASIASGNTVDIDYSIDGGTNWLTLADYNIIAGAASANVSFGTAPASYDLRITQFFTAGASGAAASVSVPEPSIIALLGLGLVGMGIVIRRRQKSA